MKKGFTLVELLAVITILGLLALLIVPKVQKTIKDSKKNIYESSAYALSREADNFYLAKKAELTSFDGCTYDFTNNSNTCDGFEFKGQKPDSGTLNIDKNGNVQFSVKFEKYCYVKQKKSDNIIVIPNCTENIELSEPVIVTSGDGLYESTIEPGRLIYRGANPNNYIWIDENGDNNKIDDELYRIISYESDGTTKVVKNTTIGTKGWDEWNRRYNSNNTFGTNTLACNAWGNSSNTLFKGEQLGENFHNSYYESPNATTLTYGQTGKLGDNSAINDYLNETWLSDKKISNYIDNHTFNVGGVYYPQEYSNGDKGLAKEKEEEKLYTWVGKIGLLSVTEFVETSTFPSCTSVYSNYDYNPLYYYKAEGETYKKIHLPESGWPCKNLNWTISSNNEWTISAYLEQNSNYNGWAIFSEGKFAGWPVLNYYDVRPAFYLKSDTLISGTGTESDPYRILN